jgi:ribosomal 30S subunit maturation factor RimM
MSELLWPCGTLGRAHGLHGELYLDLLPHGLEYLTGGQRFFLVTADGSEPSPVAILRTGGDDRRPLVRLRGVDSREQAVAVAGAVLAAAGGALTDIPAWRAGDLLGMRAESGGRELGTVTDVLQAPASDLLQIQAPGAEPVLVPLVDELVQIDARARIVHIREGLLE